MGDDLLVADYRRADARGNALTCRCPPGSRRQSRACDETDGTCAVLFCVPCGLEGFDTSTDDNSACVNCGDTTDGVDGAGDCACPAHRALQERDAGGTPLAEKRCVACDGGRFVVASDATIAGATYAGDRYACQSCPDARMAYSEAAGGCACPSTDSLVGAAAVGAQSCVDAAQRGAILASYPEAVAVQAPYKNLQTSRRGDASGEIFVDSATFRHYYARAATKCAYYDGTPTSDAACQTLANLCALTQYDLSSTPCRLYDHLESTLRAQRHTWGAREHLPWLTYARDGDDTRKITDLKMELSFSSDDGQRDAKLKFRLAAYTVNGTFLGFSELNTQFFYCGMPAPSTGAGGGEASDTSWLRYGYSFRDHFRCDLTSLYKKEQILYDLYVVDTKGLCDAVGPTDEISGECMYPVPILNKGLKNRDGNGVNKNGKTEDGDDDIFTRRFALFDVTSGVDAAGADPAVIRFAVEIKLHVVGDPRNAARMSPEAAPKSPSGPLSAVAASTDYRGRGAAASFLKREDETRARRYVPYLELKYRERTRDDVAETEGMRYTKVDVEVEYSMNPSKFWQVATVFVYRGGVDSSISTRRSPFGLILAALDCGRRPQVPTREKRARTHVVSQVHLARGRLRRVAPRVPPLAAPELFGGLRGHADRGLHVRVSPQRAPALRTALRARVLSVGVCVVLVLLPLLQAAEVGLPVNARGEPARRQGL